MTIAWAPAYPVHARPTPAPVVLGTEDDEPEPLPAPEDLEQAGRTLWEFVAGGEFDLDPHEVLVLHNACRTADNLDRIAAEMVATGVTTTNSRGDVIAHAAYVEHRQQTQCLTKTLATLRIPDIDGNRPQRRGGARGSYGATAR